MNSLLTIITKAFELFLVLDPIGNTGIVATLISGFDKRRQRLILFREITFALLLMLSIYWSGSFLLHLINVSQAAITLTGGIIFLLFAISLLFPQSSMIDIKNLEEEPFIVPISTPLIVGPSSTATLILFSHEKEMWLLHMASILLAWLITAVLILLGPALLGRLGRTGMSAIEGFIGMICTLVAVKMLLKGLKLFLADI